MKKSFCILLFIPVILQAQPEYSGISTGAFSRMGFGARGIGMGNSMSAVTSGNLVSYYNPAVSVFQVNNSIQTSYSFLSLDRNLNFINFTRRFEFYSAKDSAVENRKPRSTAGLSIGIVNSGVSDIPEYDNSGMKGGNVSTSENLFFLGLANRFSEKVSIGIGIRFYYYKLYEEISATGFGIDLGALYRFSEQWNLALVISDINSKYKWDSTPIYDQSGTNIPDKFQVAKKIGISYKNDDAKLQASAEFESRNSKTNILRAGIEYNIFEELFIRAGVDHFNVSNSDYGVKPAAGFSYFTKWESIRLGIDYAFMIEQYSPHDRHIVGVSFQF